MSAAGPVLPLLVALLAAAGETDRPRIGDPAPALPRPLDASAASATTAGELTVVEFFATWCTPCQRSLEDLREVHARLGEGAGPGDRAAAAVPFRLVLVNAAESAAIVRRFVAAARLPAGTRVALDPDGAAVRRWGGDRLPTTFILDGAGVIRHINRGHGPGYRARVERWLRALSAGAR